MTDQLFTGPHSTWEIFPGDYAKLLQYNSETGDLWWRYRDLEYFQDKNKGQQKRWNGMYAGKRAFTTINSAGYLKGTIAGKWLVAHRVAWVIFHGEIPSGEIDHINGNRTDNRICNLREVSNSQNSQNAKLRKDNKTGVQGVRKSGKSWIAQIGGVKNRIHLGSFRSLDEAAAARRGAEVSLGYHENHGRKYD